MIDMRFMLGFIYFTIVIGYGRYRLCLRYNSYMLFIDNLLFAVHFWPACSKRSIYPVCFHSKKPLMEVDTSGHFYFKNTSDVQEDRHYQ